MAAGRWRSAAFVAIVERGLVAVVAVGDDELFIPHLGADGIDYPGVGNLPDAMEDSVFIRHLDDGIGVFAGMLEKQRIDVTGVWVENEKLFEVGAGGAKQIEPVGLRLGQGLLVTE